MNNTEEVLVVPLEVEVTPTAGLIEPQGYLDFGVGGSELTPVYVDLYMQNPLKKPVRIHSVSCDSESINVEYDNVKVPPYSQTANGETYDGSVKVARLTIYCKQGISFFRHFSRTFMQNK